MVNSNLHVYGLWEDYPGGAHTEYAHSTQKGPGWSSQIHRITKLERNYYAMLSAMVSSFVNYHSNHKVSVSDLNEIIAPYINVI